ncbi:MULTISPECIES: sodium:solute symporter family protein [unclassified Halomonas]|uniref:sodium:solute symporter family protein n=1 Tax=unclassified Halomonas TaxID=2609666 RepID=UPI00209EEFE7|nr:MULTISPECIES: sodium:solute symporter family protein [unclassified Halomonas]MCP1315480.1 sodium:solute symporter family protein [Halomonas sp. 707D7]MCP1325573.1 sodium:solute symporter family protein [Halomonas sp. 707D4]
MSESMIWWSIAIYLLIAVGIAFLSRQGPAESMSGYFLGNRQMNGFVSALSYSATTYSAFMMVGLAGLTYAGGVGALGFEIIYFAGVSLVAIFGPRFWAVGKKFGFVTPSEMLGHRYNSKRVAMAVSIASCIFLIPYSAVQLAGVGYLLEGMTDGAINFTTGVVMATAIAIFFSYIAGIRSVMWTDSLQALMMIVASTLVAFLVIQGLGGFSGLFGTLERDHPASLTVPGSGLFSLVTFLGLCIPWFFFSLSNPQVSQRLFMPSSLRSMRQMLIGFLVFGFIYTLVSVLWGFSALAAFPDLARADLATPSLLASEFVPPVLGVIVMIGIMAAAVSTIDSIMLTLASMISRDVYANAKPGVDEKRQLLMGKIVVPVIALLALGFAELQLDLIAVLSVAASSGLVAMVPAIIGAFFWKRGTAAGALASVVGTSVFVLGMYATGNSLLGLPSGIWGIVVSTALFVGVSLATKPHVASSEAFLSAIKEELGRRKRAPQAPTSPSTTEQVSV